MPLDPTKLKAAREAVELSQADAARLASIAPAKWGHYEQGLYPNPGVSNVQRMAIACGVTVDALLSPVFLRGDKRGRPT